MWFGMSEVVLEMKEEKEEGYTSSYIGFALRIASCDSQISSIHNWRKLNKRKHNLSCRSRTCRVRYIIVIVGYGMSEVVLEM